MFAWVWLGTGCLIKETTHLNMADADSSSSSSEAENAINVNCSLKKEKNVLKTDLLWGERQ